MFNLSSAPFSDPRKIFIIDNGATMFVHWPIVVFVAETLVKKAAGLDKSGVDVVFTVAGNKHNKSRLKGDAGRNEFRKALEAAEPDNTDNDHLQTDMHKTLTDVITSWRDTNRPPTTVIVLTDGLWKRTSDHLVDYTIVGLAEEVTEYVGKRPFGIQFIRFGEECVEKLSKLDNDVCKKRGIRDIVDHCSWRSSVEKMFKGSIEGQHDQHEPHDPSILYNETELIALFRRFNEDSHSGSVSTNNGLAPSNSAMSRSSSRGSNTTLRWRDSAPLERVNQRRESWQPQSERPFST
jgi:hypothetical protein